jgi:hypothetical protein
MDRGGLGCFLCLGHSVGVRCKFWNLEEEKMSEIPKPDILIDIFGIN